MKNILITGKNSYIGMAFEKWLTKEPTAYKVDSVETRDGKWKEKDFSHYDVVFHVAGIAHVSADPKMEELYYQVNRDLTIEVAKKAKAAGVRQFIFMSSIIVYGDSTSSKTVITKETIPTPSNFYGESKLQAELGLLPLEDSNFKIAIVRPPMIYGKGSKGNYPRLAKLAQKTPMFPDYNNARSMLHIDNLCEFLKIMVDEEESGLYYPQNKEYVNTSQLVKMIAEAHGKKIWMTRMMNPLIKSLFTVNTVNKMFGNLVYDKEMSIYAKRKYQIRNFEETILLTERDGE